MARTAIQGTTKQDLILILEKCEKCYGLTNNGLYIIPYGELSKIKLDTKKKKHCLIVNTENNVEYCGHWFLIAIFISKLNRCAVIADGLSLIKSNKNVMDYINFFCKTNNLKLKFIKTRYQHSLSKKCGELSLYFIFRTSVLSYANFLKFDLLMKNNAINTIESMLLKKVSSHFGS